MVFEEGSPIEVILHRVGGGYGGKEQSEVKTSLALLLVLY